MNLKNGYERAKRLQAALDWVNNERVALDKLSITPAVSVSPATTLVDSTGPLTAVQIEEVKNQLTATIKVLQEDYLVGKIKITNTTHIESFIQLLFTLRELRSVQGKGKVGVKLLLSFPKQM
ncbi:hypothetical protein [Paraflavitalea speifideaquila]|uniref:hypothetical protein n=1 Tax=Paraflavitalea speifideaquila TaxID=3076558 RepID=UPI0028E9E2CF|nr:hypothetical protein [Paraflavitalea speifideiaquila]